jgi:hypothetical protein
MNNIDGNKILISINRTSAGATASQIVLAGQTSGSLSIDKEMIEYTSKTTIESGVLVRKYIPTRSTATIQVTALEDPTGVLKASDLLEICYEGTKVNFVVGATASGSMTIGGAGYLSSSEASFDQDAVVTGNMTIQVDGGLTFGTIGG